MTNAVTAPHPEVAFSAREAEKPENNILGFVNVYLDDDGDPVMGALDLYGTAEEAGDFSAKEFTETLGVYALVPASTLSTAHTATAGDGGERTWHRDGALLYTLKPHVNQFGRSRGKMVNDVTVRVEGPDADTIATEIHAALAQAPAVQAPAGEDITSPEFWKQRQAEWLRRRDAEHDAAWIDRLRRHFLASPTPTDAQPKAARAVGDEVLRGLVREALVFLEMEDEANTPGTELYTWVKVAAEVVSAHPTTGQETVATPRDGGGASDSGVETDAERLHRLKTEWGNHQPIYEGDHPWLLSMASRGVAASGAPAPREDGVREALEPGRRAYGAYASSVDSDKIDRQPAFGPWDDVRPNHKRHWAAVEAALATPSPAQEPGTGDTGDAKRALGSGSHKWGASFPPSTCNAWEDCWIDGICHDPVQCGIRGPSCADGEDAATPATTAETRGPAEGA